MQPIADLLYDLPGWAYYSLLAALLTGAIWFLWKALPYYRALSAIRSTARVPVASAEAGMVKIAGTAHPANVPKGYGIPDHVWQETSRSYNPGFSSGTYSVARILVRDDTGDCLIFAEETLVIPADIDVERDRRIFSDDRVVVTRFIRTGQTVFAIGILGRDKALAGALAQRRLRRSPQGVLMLSGKDEPSTSRYLKWRLYPAVAAACVCLWLAAIL